MTPVLVVCQILIAASTLFFLFSTPESYWLWGAYLLWIAYVGHNVAMPVGTFRLVRATESSSALAASLAVSGLAYAVGSLLGGVLFDLVPKSFVISLGGVPFDRFGLFFLVAIPVRLLTIIPLASIHSLRASYSEEPA